MQHAHTAAGRNIVTNRIYSLRRNPFVTTYCSRKHSFSHYVHSRRLPPSFSLFCFGLHNKFHLMLIETNDRVALNVIVWNGCRCLQWYLGYARTSSTHAQYVTDWTFSRAYSVVRVHTVSKFKTLLMRKIDDVDRLYCYKGDLDMLHLLESLHYVCASDCLKLLNDSQWLLEENQFISFITNWSLIFGYNVYWFSRQEDRCIVKDTYETANALQSFKPERKYFSTNTE